MKLHRDVAVQGEAGAVAALKEAIRASVVGGAWERDSEVAKKLSARRGDEDVDVFRYGGPDAPGANVFLFWESHGAHVGNIVPVASTSLSHDEYNMIAKQFHDEVLAPLAVRAGCQTELGPTVRTIDEVLPPPVLEALKRFSDAANKSTGSAHPMDAERWDDFLILAHAHGTVLGENLLMDWLVRDEGWGEDEASTLVVEYEHARRLLARYDHHK